MKILTYQEYSSTIILCILIHFIYMSVVDFSFIINPLCSANTNGRTCWVATSRLGASIIPYGPDVSLSHSAGAGNERRSATSPEDTDWASSAGNDLRPPDGSDVRELRRFAGNFIPTKRDLNQK